MNLKQLAEGAPYGLVTNIEECTLSQFWVVLLDCGIEIYQSPRSNNFSEPQSWLRLKQFCKDNNCKIMSMAFARKDLNQTGQINLNPNCDGYFYSERCRKLITADPRYVGFSDHAQGFGELNNDVLTIHWVESTTGNVEIDRRSLNNNPKSNSELAIIRK